MIPLESLPDAVVIVDRSGRIAKVNPHLEQLLGYSRDDLIGQPVEMLVPEAAREGHEAQRRGYEREPRVRAMGSSRDLSARHKAGHDVPVDIMLSPYGDGQVIAVLRDISRRRELERFRDEYVGYISHDLKNPLSIITLQSRLLTRRLAELGLAEERQALEVIAQSAGYIDRMVREMLEMSYLESQDIQLAREPVHLAEFLKAVLERTVSTSDRWRVHLEVRHAVTALCDAGRIERVLANLVQNAVKYGGAEGSITVRLEARGDRALVTVADQGPGLTAEEAGFVFEKYRRTRSAARREGLGLGLYISRKIVEAHGGQIGVESTPGRGARFWFTVPQAVSEVGTTPFVVALDPRRENPAAGLQETFALLVDDEGNALSALSALLEAEGLRVQSATNAARALELAAARRPDVVVLDVEMPDMSGLELLGRLRALHDGLPAVLMTGFQAHHAGVAEALRAGGTAYVGKPVDVDELMRVMARVLARGAAAA